MKYRVLSHSLFTAALLMAIACDMTDLESGSSNLSIRCAIDGIEETRASLVTTDNVATKYPTMTAYVVSTATKTQAFDAEDFNTADAATSLTLKNSVWKEGEYALFSYPIDAISPAMENGKLKLTDSKMKFDYEIAKNSTDTPDIVVAGVTATRGAGVIELNYKHIFTAVNVIYKDPQIGHRVTSIKVKDAYTKGTCTCDMNGNIAWSGQNTKADLVDSGTRGATYANQVLTEDGCKFMVIPEPSTDDGKITIEVVVDGVTITKTSENASGPGDIVNFYIGDHFDITTTEGVKTSGKVEENEDGTYKMTIESYVTGEYQSSSSPIDFVLLLDNSGSMEGSRLNALKTAANQFIDNILAESGVAHRIAIVEFGGSQLPYSDYLTEGSANYLKEISIIAGNDNSKNGYRPRVIKSFSNNATELKAAINSLDAKGSATKTDIGMEIAYHLLKNRAEQTHFPTLVFFTDGRPELSGYTTNWLDYGGSCGATCKADLANLAVNWAYKIKQLNYSIFSIACLGNISNKDVCSKFIEVVSSKYPSAQAVFSGYTPIQQYSSGTTSGAGINLSKHLANIGAANPDGKQYYYDITDESQFNNVFDEIRRSIISAHPSIDIHGDASMKTIVSEAFNLPENYDTSTSVKFYTCAQTGYNPFTFSDTLVQITGLTLVSDLNTKTFSVSGFDYAANFCTTTSTGSMGKKLVIVIDGLKPNPDRQGTGTNETIVYTTGLYNNDEALSQIDPAGMTVEYKAN